MGIYISKILHSMNIIASFLANCKDYVVVHNRSPGQGAYIIGIVSNINQAIIAMYSCI